MDKARGRVSGFDRFLLELEASTSHVSDKVIKDSNEKCLFREGVEAERVCCVRPSESSAKSLAFSLEFRGELFPERVALEHLRAEHYPDEGASSDQPEIFVTE